MIKLIKDGVLPNPANCVSCGYGGPERYFYWFKAFDPNTGRALLLCTTCMKEGALQDDNFVSAEEFNEVVAKLQEQVEINERLELASDKFRVDFDRAVDTFHSNLLPRAEEVFTRDQLVEVAASSESVRNEATDSVQLDKF